METIYDVNYFIKKFQAIPEELWHIGSFSNALEDKFCAFGHCGCRAAYTNSFTDEGMKLHYIFFQNVLNVAHTNDGIETNTYPQHTPKQRILAALYDIYEKTYGKKYGEPEQPKVIYKTVVIDSAVKELQTSLTEN